jgi:Primase C terminal 1 (PriCT-1)
VAESDRRTTFRWVDFAARAQPGFRNHVVTVDEVPGLIERYRAEECYASIFRFSADVLRYLAEHRVDGRPSIAGYDGRLWAPFLPIDVDAHPPDATLDEALLLARRVHDLLIRRWQAPPEAVHAYFSGAKGFHVLVDTRVFGRVAPAADLNRVFTHLRLAVLRELPDRARLLFDLAIGDAVRLLRLPNTRHAGSGLFKIPLAPDELLHRTAAEIAVLARAPRPLTRLAAAGLEPSADVAPVPALVEHFQRVRRALRHARGPHPYRMGPPPERAEEALCAARLAMWRGDLPPGTRNNAAIRLASAFRVAGYMHEEALGLLRGWSARQSRPLPDAEIASVVASAYARPYPYAYGCHDEVIRGFCPYAERLADCTDYREQHPRSGRGGTR